MKRRLFWKILIGFWCTFVLINQGVWLIYLVYWEPWPSYERSVHEILAPIQLATAREAIASGGLSAWERARTTWPAEYRGAVTIEPGRVERSGPNVMATQASGPDGQLWRVLYRLPEDDRHQWRGSDIMPPELALLGTLGGLIFSASLAWYLTRPVWRIRKGFEQLAAGELATRLRPSMGRRRDEIADLAHDFDRMAERLQQLVAVRDQLLHDVSHELRSPLARLNVAIALLRRDPGQTAVSLERIETESRRLDALVGELLSLARSESGEHTRDTYFSLSELLEAVVANAAFEARAAGVSVSLTAVWRDDVIVRGTAELMRRALENIVRNAVQVSHAGQAVDVALSIFEPARSLVITIADEGTGVPNDQLERMFEPFNRLGALGGDGYGLGLAIARRAILAFGGSIHATNRTPHGLVVSIELPYAPSIMRPADSAG